MMEPYQKGEVVTAMLLMMGVVILAVGWMGYDHMGMGYGGGHAEPAPGASSISQPSGKGESNSGQSGNKSEPQGEHTHDK